MTSMREWRKAFHKLDICPWAGPRPLEANERDASLFVGREEEARDFVMSVKEHRIVILSGESGVGKSSLVNVKLLPALRASGYTPLVCRDWSVDSISRLGGEGAAVQGIDAEAFMRKKLESAIATEEHFWASASGSSAGSWPKPPFRVESGVDICRALDECFDQRAVLVLDQFEELIRYQPELYAAVTAWILQSSRRYRCRIVVSLRLEYAHRLRALEQSADPFSLTSMVLEPVSNVDTIRAIIAGTSANDSREVSSAISDAALEEIVNEWNESSGTSTDRWHGAGLLHLQATLYALYSMAREEGVLCIQNAHVDLLRARGADSSRSDVVRLFEVGLREAVRLKLARCQKACADVELDQTFVEGTLAAAYRLIPHLSSGGYKLEREAWDLAQRALDREFEHLLAPEAGIDLRDAKSVFMGLSARLRQEQLEGDDLFSVSRIAVANGLDRRLRESIPRRSGASIKHGFDVAPWDEDPRDVSAGPLLGFSPVEVLIEELRRVVFAQHWLEVAQLVRPSAPEPGRTMLSLIHDGFADALEYWVKFRAPGPQDALFLLTAAKGRTFDWRAAAPLLGTGLAPDEERYLSAFDGEKSDATWINLRWRDCQVSANFRRVVFVNCDFTGTRFRDCIFRGVTFVNCLMDNVAFEECSIRGGIRPGEIDRSEATMKRGTPSFRVFAGRQKVQELIHYRRIDLSAEPAEEYLFSRTSGISALPLLRSFDPSSGEVKRETGGLSMYGGRLSSLLIQNCRFEPDGVLGFRSIAGSSLDVVETRRCKIDVVSSAMRGLTFTRLVSSERSEELSRVDLTVNDSFLTNCWFGDGLTGSALFFDSQLLQVFNLSDTKEFVVVVENCGHDGVVNAAEIKSNAKARELGWITDDRARAGVADAVLRMDYRSEPARMELARPANDAGSTGS